MADARAGVGDHEADRPSRRRSIVAVALGLLGVALLVALGTWQVERLYWKEGVLQRIAERTHAAPRSTEAVAALAARGEDVDYYPVEASGQFRHDAERFFITTFDGQSGWNVFTPLDLGANRFVWVNRGYVPFDRRDPKTREDGEIAGRTTVSGLSRNVATTKPSFLVPANDIARNQFYWKNLDDMGAGANLPPGAVVLPFVIDANAAATPPGGLPVGGQTVIDIPNNHLQYAITWYGLALALAAMIGWQVVEAWRRPRREPRRRG